MSMNAPDRDDFPLLEQKTYLASHSLGAVPASTEDALTSYYEQWASQGIEAWDGPWYAAIDTFNEQIADVLNAPSSDDVTPMQNTTRALAGVASCFTYDDRDTIVLTDQEFTTTYPFWRGYEDLGASIEIVESGDDGFVDPDDVADAIDDDTLLVATSHAYFRSGQLQDLEPITEAAHEEGAYMLGDGYQAVGTAPVDVQELDVDFYVGGSHKWLCGGPGAGYLYVHLDVDERPRLTGWFGLEDTFAYDTDTGRGTPADGAERYLGGTPNIPGLVAAREGIDAVRDVGIDTIRDRSTELTERVIDHADSHGCTVNTPRNPDDRTGFVAIDFDGAEQAADALLDEDIIVDWRPDCGIRISPHFYNTADEIDELYDTLDDIT